MTSAPSIDYADIIRNLLVNMDETMRQILECTEAQLSAYQDQSAQLAEISNLIQTLLEESEADQDYSEAEEASGSDTE